MSQLKPCPFCGSAAEIVRYGNHRVSTQYSCTDCGASMETGEEFDHGERWNQRFNEDVLKWISVKDKTPKHEPGKWSDPVIAMSDIGLVFRLSYCGGWQRTGDFMSTGSSKVTHWMPMPKIAEDDNVS